MAKQLLFEDHARAKMLDGVSKLADAVAEWDVGLIGAEPARAEQIVFTAAYLEIESTYLVPPGSKKTDPSTHLPITAAPAWG